MNNYKHFFKEFGKIETNAVKKYTFHPYQAIFEKVEDIFDNIVWTIT